MRGQPNHRQAIDRPQLPGHLPRSPCQTGQNLVTAKEALIGHPCYIDPPRARLTIFLELDHLVESCAPGPFRHDPPRVLIDDLNSTGQYDIVFALPVQMFGGQGVAQQLVAPRG